MSAIVMPASAPPTAPPLPSYLHRLRRFTRAEYHKLGEAGIIGPDEKVELLDGYVVEKPVKNLPHRGATRRLTVRLARFLPAGWFVQIQDPVGLPTSEPEPDAVVLRGDETTYDQRSAEPPDIGIVIEVADTSLRTDRREKGQLYAAAGIAVYWIVNVADGQVEVYTDPDPAATLPGYAARADFRPGQDVPITLGGQTVSAIPAADLLP